MTDHHYRATGAEWAEQHYFATNRIDTASPCIIELLHRVQAIELALRAQVDREARKRFRDNSSAPEPAVSIVNINDDVSVKLTDYGRSIIPHVDLMYMETGTDGWTRIQMHHFMRIFGPRIWSGENIAPHQSVDLALFERNEIRIHP